MADIKSITVSRSARVNLGDYQSTEFFVSMTGEPDETLEETPHEAAVDIAGHVETAIVESMTQSLRKRGKKVTRRSVAERFGFAFANVAEEET